MFCGIRVCAHARCRYDPSRYDPSRYDPTVNSAPKLAESAQVILAYVISALREPTASEDTAASRKSD
eukprot:8796832-Pyramimonas_sp.AAC.2